MANNIEKTTIAIPVKIQGQPLWLELTEQQYTDLERSPHAKLSLEILVDDLDQGFLSEIKIPK
jgi:hypothetical protein